MRMPVRVLRLPRGPDPNSRGFDPSSPRYASLCRTTISAFTESRTDCSYLRNEQHTRSVLREQYLRSLLAMSLKQIRFSMYERVLVEAKFGAADIDVLNFQVSDLQTPLGVQKEALIRCPDVISYTFELCETSTLPFSACC
ncbi:gem-associated protein 7 [Anguilla anguilla]|uniref:SUZ-C domain-containing protein n=1 Tax=Anguilla anguilla TaxID=7936 RepID=A0A0E9WQK3_ANGAN|nr:gem-associated protein 7 [Anguilla anguilla]